MAAAFSPSLLTCGASVRADGNCYVLDLALKPPETSSSPSPRGVVTFAAALSSHKIHLYEATSTGTQVIRFVGPLLGHTKRITAVKFDCPAEPNVLFSSSLDGTIRAWNTKTGEEMAVFQAPGGGGKEIWSLAVSPSGAIIAGGVTGEVILWSRRTGEVLAIFDDSHMNDVTQLRFHPSSDKVILLTSSEDGLVCVFDLTSQIDEEDSFLGCQNVHNAVADFGFYGPRGHSVWIRTCVEGIHLWDWRSACNDHDEDQSNMDPELAEPRIENARELVAHLVRQSTQPDSQALQEVRWTTMETPLVTINYLVGCHYDHVTDKLWLLAGNNAGLVAFFPMRRTQKKITVVLGDMAGDGDDTTMAVERDDDQNDIASSSASALPMESVCVGLAIDSPDAILMGTHNVVVRAVLWPWTGPSGLYISGGEDSRLCLWTHPPRRTGAEQESQTQMYPEGGSRGEEWPHGRSGGGSTGRDIGGHGGDFYRGQGGVQKKKKKKKKKGNQHFLNHPEQHG